MIKRSALIYVILGTAMRNSIWFNEEDISKFDYILDKNLTDYEVEVYLDVIKMIDKGFNLSEIISKLDNNAKKILLKKGND